MSKRSEDVDAGFGCVGWGPDLKAIEVDHEYCTTEWEHAKRARFDSAFTRWFKDNVLTMPARTRHDALGRNMENQGAGTGKVALSHSASESGIFGGSAVLSR